MNLKKCFPEQKDFVKWYKNNAVQDKSYNEHDSIDDFVSDTSHECCTAFHLISLTFSRKYLP